jgi:tetratricopeptide (TPR) repeat protein
MKNKTKFILILITSVAVFFLAYKYNESRKQKQQLLELKKIYDNITDTNRVYKKQGDLNLRKESTSPDKSEEKSHNNISIDNAIISYTRFSIDDEIKNKSHKELQNDIAFYTDTINRGTKNINLYYKRGLSKFYIKDFKGAIKDFDEILKINPLDSDVLLKRGSLKAEIGNHEKAIIDYTKSINIYPTFLAFESRGISQTELGDYSSAIEDFSKAIEIDPYNSDTYYNRGFTRYYMKEYTLAIEDFTKAIEINPSRHDAYNNRGLSKIETQDFKGALRDFYEALKLNKENANYYYNYGVAQFWLKDYSGSVETFSRAIHFNPSHAMAYNNRGLSKYLLNKNTSACEDFKKAEELGFETARKAFLTYCN